MRSRRTPSSGGEGSRSPGAARFGGSWPTLAAIGTVAGMFSGLFGVGGGVVIVPLLVLWLGFGERRATGTSLTAIAIIAAVATLAHGAYGNVHLREGLLVGLPAVAGVVAGTELQRRVPTRAISLMFAAMLVVTAGELLLR
ncbi:MAG TPA: sulfite exporter TauE/SafE family protein [Solirubrobacteraceae bacterium]|nr:sulfite exporter TauE/SafE family protein [Solirubrobacteraceae bacterium]